MNKKVLMISWSDFFGGAARACYEKYRSQYKYYKNVDLLVQKKISNNKLILHKKKLTFNSLLRKYFSFFVYKLRITKNDHSYNLINSDILKNINLNKYGIINIHWINSETLSIKDISQINQKIVMSLHDMWAICGSEHYLYNLPNIYFKNGSKKKVNYFDSLIWKIKKKLWKKKFQVIVPSIWLAKLVKKSRLMSKFPLKIIPYSVDQEVFKVKKINTFHSNNKIIKKNSKIVDVLFISAGKLFNYRKGFKMLDEVISTNKHQHSYRILIAGNTNFIDRCKIKSNCVILGNITNLNKLSDLYNFSDLLALPSILDNLPNVGLEAHSCGKPIVAFKVGGIPDIVSHKKTGYLAKPYDLDDFMKGIEFVYKNKKKLGYRGFLKSKKWSPNVISKKHNKLFKEL